MSKLRIVVYSSGFTYAAGAVDEAGRHEDLIFTTLYPGGIYGTCSFFVPRKSSAPHEFKAGYRVAVFDGLNMIWEGQIDVATYITSRGREGLRVECTGYWGAILKRRRWNKVWCDTRLTDDKWVISITTTGQEDKFRLERYNRLRITPVETEFVQYDDMTVVYTLPTGQTVNHVTGSYEFNEGTQNFVLQVNDHTAGTNLVQWTSSGTSTFSGTPDTGCAAISFKMYANATLTTDYDNGVYGQVSGVKVYTDAGTPTASEIVKDIRAQITNLSSEEAYINTNAQVFEPAFMEAETCAEYLSKIAAYGDTSLNPWAAGVLRSKESLSPSYYPVLYFEQQRALTDYEYTFRLDEIEGGCQIEIAYDEIYNYIYLEYTDDNGDRVLVTPDDDANLKDTTSIAAYGQRDMLLRLGDSGVTEAKIYARRYLAWFKDPKYRLTTPLVVKGMVRTKGAGLVPVHEIRAGLRVRIENYLQEIGGSGMIFLITATSFDEKSGRLTISAGTPNPLETLSARRRGL